MQEAKLAEISTKLAQASQAERDQFRAHKTELLESRKQKRHEIAVLMLTKEIGDNVCLRITHITLNDADARVGAAAPAGVQVHQDHRRAPHFLPPGANASKLALPMTSTRPR